MPKKRNFFGANFVFSTKRSSRGWDVNSKNFSVRRVKNISVDRWRQVRKLPLAILSPITWKVCPSVVWKADTGPPKRNYVPWSTTPSAISRIIGKWPNIFLRRSPTPATTSLMANIFPSKRWWSKEGSPVKFPVPENGARCFGAWCWPGALTTIIMISPIGRIYSPGPRRTVRQWNCRTGICLRITLGFLRRSTRNH